MNCEETRNKYIVFGVQDPIRFIESHVVRVIPELTIDSSVESLEYFLECDENAKKRFAYSRNNDSRPSDAVRGAQNFDDLREVIKSHETLTGKKSVIKKVGRFCSDPNSTLIWYDLEGEDKRYLAILYGYKIKKDSLEAPFDFIFKK